MKTRYLTTVLLKKYFRKYNYIVDKNFYYFLIFSIFITLPTSLRAQVVNNTFSETSGTYTDLVGATTAIASGWDDTVTANTIPIGFTFTFNGLPFTNCSVSSNGFITFGATTAATNNFTPISSATLYQRAIVAVGVDLIDDNAQPIIYLTTGTAPNRVFTVQWKQTRRLGRSGQFNFQIQISETTNVIKIIYGSCAPTGNNAQNIDVQVGLRGASNADFNNRSLTTNSVVWDNNTIAGTVNTAACRTRGQNYPNSGRTFIWSPIYAPTITSLGSSSGCAGTVITINGTNFAGIIAANVKIGGTSVANILTNTGTQITATIGAGTTGLVTVQNAAGTATSAGNFTVNAAPAITVQPAIPAAICVGTLSRNISVTATGSTTYQWRKNGINLTNIAPFSNVTTATLTITAPVQLDAGTYDVVVSNSIGCSVTSNAVLLTVTTVPVIAATPTPSAGAVGLCFSGAGAVTSVSWGAVVGAVNYDIYFGAGTLPGAITSANLAATTYTPAALVASTNYFWKVVAKNACGSAIGSNTWTFSTQATTCICQPNNSIGPGSADQISNVTLGVLNNTTDGALASPFYTFYNMLPIPNIQRGLTQPVSVTMGTDKNQFAAVWIDYNNDGTFQTTEGVITGNAGVNTPILINMAVPAGAVLGNVKMRVRGGNDVTMTTSDACTNFTTGLGRYGETEDYIVNIVNSFACSAPVAPTNLSLSPNNTSIAGSFTFTSPLPDSYITVISASATAPTPISGTAYTVGGTVGAGYTVIDKDLNNAFSTVGLTASTIYYFYVFSIKSICTGGPVYSAVLSGSTTTTAASQGCITATSTTKTYFINTFKTVGNLTNISNINSGYTNAGYTDYTSLATTTQIPGAGINAKFESNFSITFKAWVDWNRDGVFDNVTELMYDPANYGGAATTFGFTVPLAALGDYRLRIRASSSSNAATLPCGNLPDGETEDYKLTIIDDCVAKITNVVDGKRCDIGVVDLAASTTTAATEFRWYNSEFGGTLIGISFKIGATLDTAWTTPSLTTTTEYWVAAAIGTGAGACESFYREKVIAKINATSIITFVPTNPIICGENTTIAVNATGDFEIFDLINEDFEGTAQLNTVNTTANGLEWTTRPSIYKPTLGILWKPAISSRAAGNKFAFTSSDLIVVPTTNSSLISNALNTTSFVDLTLTYRHYFSYYAAPGDVGSVQISTDGGATWTTLIKYTSNQGEAGSFTNVTIPLPTYLNQTNLKVRFWYDSSGGDGWALDDIRLFGTKPINTTFSWGGGADTYADAAATIPYNPLTMSLATVYIKPTALQLASPTWTFTANATIANGCVVSKPITITNNTKKWLGTTTDWNIASNWEPAGIPTIANCVIISNHTIMTSGTNGYGKNLIVKPTGNLNVQPNSNLIIEDLITVNTGGIFNLEDNSSLTQINNVTNLGNINYNRIAPGIRGFDYVYWSSPVLNQNLDNIYTSPSQGLKYSWDTLAANANSGLGNWISANGSTMNLGQGYIVRGSSNFGMPSTNIGTNFNGVPNNGSITIKARRGNMNTTTVPSIYNNVALGITDDNWSLLGNPYPSAINGLQFLSTNSANLVGSLYLWRHINAPIATTSPFYQNFAYNYNLSDYLAINFTGPTTPGATDIIKTGQAFMVLRNEGAQDLTGVDILFNNAMRINGSVPYANNNFYRAATNIPINNNPTITERHRIWLDLINDATLSAETTLLGYVQGATTGVDNYFDAPYSIADSNVIYSVIDNQNFIIQGRPTPFDADDQVPLAMNIINAGNFKIAINTVDGLFDSQDIFIEDLLLNSTHDLKTAPYSFASDAGNFQNRFVVKYTNQSLSTNTFDNENDLIIATNNKIEVKSTQLNINKIEVFDLLGRKIEDYSNINYKLKTLDNLTKSNKILIIKTTLENDVVISKKIIF